MNKKEYKSPQFKVYHVRIKHPLLAGTQVTSGGLGSTNDEAESKAGSTMWNDMDDDDDK